MFPIVWRKTIAYLLLTTFFVYGISLPSPGFAQLIPSQLPQPGEMVNVSVPYKPLLIKGIKINPQNPMQFDFLIAQGDSGLKAGDKGLQEQSQRLIKYFLACLAIPEEDLWVNLSPYEKDRMIPDTLGKTELGTDLLAQDYILKQLTASLIYPKKGLGKEFWDRVYAKARQLYGTSEVPVNTFNKVWILADSAKIFERNDTAFIVNSHLKVMLDEDYLAKQKHQQTKASSVSSQIVREIILPEIEKEVNTGKNFATIRQIFNAFILAAWYKKNLKDAFLNQVYTDKNKTGGINVDDPSIKEQIFHRYLQAYKKGVFNFIKDDIDEKTSQPVPRKYFSGGTKFDSAMFSTVRDPQVLTSADMEQMNVDFAVKTNLLPEDTPQNVIMQSHDGPPATKGGSIIKYFLENQWRWLTFLKIRGISLPLEGKDLHIVLIGPGKDAGDLQVLLNHFPLAKRIDILDSIDLSSSIERIKILNKGKVLPQITFSQADITRPVPQIQGADVVIAMRVFDENFFTKEAILKANNTIAAMLRPGGIFIQNLEEAGSYTNKWVQNKDFQILKFKFYDGASAGYTFSVKRSDEAMTNSIKERIQKMKDVFLPRLYAFGNMPELKQGLPEPMVSYEEDRYGNALYHVQLFLEAYSDRTLLDIDYIQRALKAALVMLKVSLNEEGTREQWLQWARKQPQASRLAMLIDFFEHNEHYGNAMTEQALARFKVELEQRLPEIVNLMNDINQRYGNDPSFRKTRETVPQEREEIFDIAYEVPNEMIDQAMVGIDSNMTPEQRGAWERFYRAEGVQGETFEDFVRTRRNMGIEKLGGTPFWLGIKESDLFPESFSEPNGYQNQGELMPPWEKEERIAAAARSLIHGEMLFKGMRQMLSNDINEIAVLIPAPTEGVRDWKTEIDENFKGMAAEVGSVKNLEGEIYTLADALAERKNVSSYKTILTKLAHMMADLDSARGKQQKYIDNLRKLLQANAPQKLERANQLLKEYMEMFSVLRLKIESRLLLADGGQGTDNIPIKDFIKILKNQLLIKSRGQKVVFDMGNLDEEPIVMNRFLLASALYNIIYNGLEIVNSNNTGVVIVSFKKESNNRVSIVISDNGPGVRADLMEINPVTNRKKIFDLNVSTNKAAARQHGLGLTEAYYALKGNIDVRNKPEGGAEFTMTLPSTDAAMSTPDYSQWTFRERKAKDRALEGIRMVRRYFELKRSRNNKTRGEIKAPQKSVDAAMMALDAERLMKGKVLIRGDYAYEMGKALSTMEMLTGNLSADVAEGISINDAMVRAIETFNVENEKQSDVPSAQLNYLEPQQIAEAAAWFLYGRPYALRIFDKPPLADDILLSSKARAVFEFIRSHDLFRDGEADFGSLLQAFASQEHLSPAKAAFLLIRALKALKSDEGLSIHVDFDAPMSAIETGGKPLTKDEAMYSNVNSIRSSLSRIRTTKPLDKSGLRILLGRISSALSTRNPSLDHLPSYSAMLSELDDMDSEIRGLLNGDSAMAVKGGIDLKTSDLNMEVQKQGQGVLNSFNPEFLQRFRSDNFIGVIPVIIKITPIKNSASLLELDTNPRA